MRFLSFQTPAKLAIVGVVVVTGGTVLGVHMFLGKTAVGAHFQMEPTATCLSDAGWGVTRHNESAEEDGGTFPYLNYLDATRGDQKTEINFFRSSTDARRTAKVDNQPIMSGGAYANGNAEVSFERAPTAKEKEAADHCLKDGRQIAARLAAHAAAERRRAQQYLPSNKEFAWSPNGKLIALGTDRRVTTNAGTMYVRGVEILDGTTVKWIPSGETPNTVPDWYPSSDFTWSPDSKEIAYVTGDGIGEWGTGISIVSVESPGDPRQIVQAATNGDGVGQVAWSPDGNQVLFEGDLGIMRVYVDQKHGLPRVILPNAEDAAWSPDSTQIAYIAGEGTNINGVGVVDSDGENARILVDDPNVRSVGWLADHRIAYDSETWPGQLQAVATTSGAKPVNLTPNLPMGTWSPELTLTPDMTAAAFATGTNPAYWFVVNFANAARTPIPQGGLTEPAAPPLKDSCRTAHGSVVHDCTVFLTNNDGPAFIADHLGAAKSAGAECKGVALAEAALTSASAAVSAGETSTAQQFLRHVGGDFSIEWLGRKIGTFLNGSTDGCQIAKQQIATALAIHNATASEPQVKYRERITAINHLVPVPIAHPNLCRWEVEIDDVKTLDIRAPVTWLGVGGKC